MTDRSVFALRGGDRVSFLQGLVTNNIDRAADGIIYTALLTPQGKFIADFFVLGRDTELLIDVASSHAATLAQRLTMYRLRADVSIAETQMIVSRGTCPMPEGAYRDPRHPDLGWRAYGAEDISDDTDWDRLRVDLVIPETGIELTGDSYILEAGFEALSGVDFKKGCFVGQEIVARMKHKTELKKGLVKVSVEGAASPGDAITANGKAAGTLHTVAGDKGLAHLRFDRATGDMQAGAATIRRV
ncbi:folate-binding protein [Yoonia sp. BS5-3]|uniref:Folate-binding protein YgfZ n=1 Tax=Yoonia phaeophyticola TaxID=3137369 RepID=A0ABZ2V3J4_9RHOB